MTNLFCVQRHNNEHLFSSRTAFPPRPQLPMYHKHRFSCHYRWFSFLRGVTLFLNTRSSWQSNCSLMCLSRRNTSASIRAQRFHFNGHFCLYSHTSFLPIAPHYLWPTHTNASWARYMSAYHRQLTRRLHLRLQSRSKHLPSLALVRALVIQLRLVLLST